MESQDSDVSQLAQPISVSGPSFDRSKLESPPPLPASMTPPPSSQKAPLVHQSTTTPTPPQSLLSSPPPTARTPSMARHHDTVAGPYSATDIATATADELRNMLEHTARAYREAKASTAGQHLQYNLLAMERSEQMKRMEVELEMKNKEVEVLQRQARHGGSAFPTPVMTNARLMSMSPNEQQYANLRNRCDVLEIQNDELRYRCDDLRAVMLENEAVLKEENRNLRERIRENRKHLNMLRNSNISVDGIPYSAFATPVAPPRQRQDVFATPKSRGDDAFSQLLLADQMLSQEANTTPSTPVPGQNRRGPNHQRTAHSLSSLPATPMQARSVPAFPRMQNALHTPRQIFPPRVSQTAPQQSGHKRLSRDSTISASDVDEPVDVEADYVSSSSVSDGEDLPESQASQEARNMLRKSTSFGKTGSARSSQRSEAVARSSGLLQTKIYGPIKKVAAPSSATKRKVTNTGSPISVKKARASNSVGLGIGNWNTASG